MVRELFEMARSKKACLIFFDEIDAIGGARFDDGAGGDNEVSYNITNLSLVIPIDFSGSKNYVGIDQSARRFRSQRQHQSADGHQQTRHFGPRLDETRSSR